MTDVDPRLVAALSEQLERRRDGSRVGWKLGVGEAERIGGHIAVGHLSSATVLAPGSTYTGGGSDLRADAEVAVELGEDAAIASYGAALELVDLAIGDDPQAVVSGNVFHRAVAFSSAFGAWPEGGVEGRLIVNGEIRASGRPADDLPAKVEAAGEILRAVGEALHAGDRVITGSIVQVPVHPGDEVVADLGALGRVALAIR